MLTVVAIAAGDAVGETYTCWITAAAVIQDMTGDGAEDLLTVGSGTTGSAPGLWLARRRRASATAPPAPTSGHAACSDSGMTVTRLPARQRATSNAVVPLSRTTDSPSAGRSAATGPIRRLASPTATRIWNGGSSARSSWLIAPPRTLRAAPLGDQGCDVRTHMLDVRFAWASRRCWDGVF